MNFSLKSLVLLFLVSSILFACKNESKVGLDVLPQGQHIGTYMEDTFSVELTTILPDSVNTTNPYNIWVGDFNDPNFGKLSANTYTEVDISSPGYTLPTDAVYDSLTFTFKYGLIKFGDTTKPFTMNIFKLNEMVDSATNYFSNSSLKYNTTPIGSITFSPSDLINRNTDSVSIKLDDNLGKELFGKFGYTEFSTSIAFNHYFNGLVIDTDGNNSAIIGGSLTADSATSLRLSRMRIHYHATSTATSTQFFDFPIYSTSRKFTNFISNRAGTVISSLTKPNDSLSTNATAYIQAGSGLSVKLAFPTIKKLKESLGEVVINKAELIIPSVDIKNKYTNTAPSLYMFQAKSNGTLALGATGLSQPIQTDGSGITGNSSVQSIIFDYDANQYKVILTDYIQALMYNKASQYYLLKSAFTGADNVLIGNSKHTTAPIKLRVHYSRIQ